MMAIFKRLSKNEIKASYTHYALAYGIYPVYINCDDDACSVAVRNWFPDCGLTAMNWMVQTILSISGQENIFMFKITEKINKG
jgi:hypothetical protein